MDEQNKSVSDGDAMDLRKKKERKAVDIAECHSKPPEDKKITAAGEATSAGLTKKKRKEEGGKKKSY